MNLAEELEIGRINAALPFHDPIGVVRKWGDKEFTVVAGSWRVPRRRRALRRAFAYEYKWGLHNDEF